MSQRKRISRMDLVKWRLKLYKKSLKGFWEEYRRKRSALLGLAVLVVLSIIAAFPEFFAPHGVSEIVGPPWRPPSWEYPLGTDDLGRDMLTQLIYGARTSMIVGLSAAALSMAIGGAVGIISGFYGGIIDDILMRVTEFFLTIPSFPLMVVLAFILKPSLWNIILVITIVIWTQPAKVIRSEVLSLRERLYVVRARVIGYSNRQILLKYILPRVLPLGFATMVISIGWAIPSEAFLSWIGLGDPTQVSWGMILYYAFGRGSFTTGAWWHFVPPGLMILIVTTAFTVMGHGMEEVLNPRLRRV